MDMFVKLQAKWRPVSAPGNTRRKISQRRFVEMWRANGRVRLTWVVLYFFVPFRSVAFYFQSSFTSLLPGRDFSVRVTFSSITLSLELPVLKVGCTLLQENLINLTHSLAGALCPCVCWVHVIPAILLGVLVSPCANRGGSV